MKNVPQLNEPHSLRDEVIEVSGRGFSESPDASDRLVILQMVAKHGKILFFSLLVGENERF
jgi:hypothetical protein